MNVLVLNSGSSSLKFQLIATDAGRISTDDSSLHAFVIPTDEELLIARDTVRCILGEPDVSQVERPSSAEASH
jgi:acetate kinase